MEDGEKRASGHDEGEKAKEEAVRGRDEAEGGRGYGREEMEAVEEEC